MIQIAEREEQQKQMLAFCEKNAFGCKIASIALAYGFDKKFSCFWIEDKTENVYCLVDDTMIISGIPDNAEETKSFLHMLGAKKIMLSQAAANKLDLSRNILSGDVMQKTISGNRQEFFCGEEINIRSLYYLLEEYGMASDFEAFYLDLSHRLRHQSALVVTEYQEDELIGAAVISSVTDKAALLSAVVVKEEYRRNKLATRLIQKAEKALAGRTVYLYKEKDKHEEFYHVLGYQKADEWVTAEL